jgi:hypothetical protein
MTGSLVVSHVWPWSLIVEVFSMWVVEGAIIVAVINRKSRWIKRAYRLARESGIELPSRLADRVARRLRNEYLVVLAVYPLAALPMWLFSVRSANQGAAHWATWFPWLALLLPVLLVCYSFAAVLVARWNSPGPTRVSHFRQISIREAFTPSEILTLAAGVGATFTAIMWGLVQVHAGTLWWICDLAAVTVATMLWWRMEVAVMSRPSMAGDATELDWDDVLRFRRVRSLAVNAAWTPPLVIFLLDFYVDLSLNHFQHFAMVPIYISAAVVVGVFLIFRQGRQLWRLEGR